MGVPATVGQLATAQPCCHACHAHAPHAHDGAQRRFAQGCQERSWRHILRDCMRSASVECVSEADWARLPTGLRHRERSESARHLDLSHGAYRAPMREVVLSVARRALGARNVCPRRQYRLSDMYYRRQGRGEARGEV